MASARASAERRSVPFPHATHDDGPLRPIVFLAWVRFNPRSQGLARRLGARMVFMPWAAQGMTTGQKLRSWARSAWVTAAEIRRSPSDAMVVVQAPPVFAPTVALAMVASSPRVLIVDVHSGALNDLRWKWSFPLMRWILRRSDGVITTNEQLLQGTDLDPAPVFVLHDPLQDRREAARRSPRQTRPYVVFPASGSWDEPVDAVRGAAALLEGRVDVHVTGHVQAEPGSTRVRYTGYLPRAEYEELLAGAAAILALCTEDATMQRSAYEALELGIPIVSSSTTVLQEALGDSAVYVENTPEAIVRGIEEVLEREFDLRAASGHVLVSMQEQGDRVIQELLRLGADRARSAR